MRIPLCPVRKHPSTGLVGRARPTGLGGGSNNPQVEVDVGVGLPVECEPTLRSPRHHTPSQIFACPPTPMNFVLSLHIPLLVTNRGISEVLFDESPKTHRSDLYGFDLTTFGRNRPASFEVLTEM
ncbi:MAG: hypothetical protein QW429_03175 [Thermoprotei archaeon]